MASDWSPEVGVRGVKLEWGVTGGRAASAGVVVECPGLEDRESFRLAAAFWPFPRCIGLLTGVLAGEATASDGLSLAGDAVGLCADAFALLAIAAATSACDGITALAWLLGNASTAVKAASAAAGVVLAGDAAVAVSGDRDDLAAAVAGAEEAADKAGTGVEAAAAAEEEAEAAVTAGLGAVAGRGRA